MTYQSKIVSAEAFVNLVRFVVQDSNEFSHGNCSRERAVDSACKLLTYLLDRRPTTREIDRVLPLYPRK
jgi:hypothetical protein